MRYLLRQGTMRSRTRFACLLGLALLGAFPAWKNQGRSAGYRVDVTRQAMLARHGIYELTARVRDRDGQPVRDADARMRLHAGLNSESPRDTRVVVAAGGAR